MRIIAVGRHHDVHLSARGEVSIVRVGDGVRLDFGGPEAAAFLGELDIPSALACIVDAVCRRHLAACKVPV